MEKYLKTEDQDKGHLTARASEAPTVPPPKIDANDLERMAKARPDECFLKGTGVLKLIGAVRQLEAVIATLAAPTPPASSPVAGEPLGWYFQHDETGRFNVLIADGINTPESFVKGNPRYSLCGPLFATPVAPSVDAAWVEKAMDLADDHAHIAWEHGWDKSLNVDAASRNALRAHLSTALPAQPKE